MTKLIYNIAIFSIIFLNIVLVFLFALTGDISTIYLLPFGVYTLYIVLDSSIKYDQKKINN